MNSWMLTPFRVNHFLEPRLLGEEVVLLVGLAPLRLPLLQHLRLAGQQRQFGAPGDDEDRDSSSASKAIGAAPVALR